MSVTTNAFGKISISDEAIALVTGHCALQCYGVIDLVPKKLTDNIAEIFNKQPLSRGVKVSTFNDRIFIDIYVIIKHGLSVPAVTESLKKTIKYNLESFTGMIVETVNVYVVGLKI
jgi:uncharacterized alkaline shock family protein YloU